MKILVTGAKGMVGTSLVNNLKNIKDGKNRTRPNIQIDEIYEYDLGDEASSMNTARIVTSSSILRVSTDLPILRIS